MAAETRRGPGLDSPDLDHTSRLDDDQDERTADPRPWWAMPPSAIRPEQLEKLDRALRRAAVLVAHVGGEVTG